MNRRRNPDYNEITYGVMSMKDLAAAIACYAIVIIPLSVAIAACMGAFE